MASNKSSLGNAGASEFYPIGHMVTLVNLSSRPELNGAGATVGADDPSKCGDGRIAVILNSGGEKLR
eukprot:11491476-Karenia_brevis.AAC.1